MKDAPTTPAKSAFDAPHPAVTGAGDAWRCNLAEIHARRGTLIRLAYRFCWNHADAEDAVQSAILQASTHGHQLASPERIWSWIRAIVIRQCHDLRRRARRAQRAGSVLQDQARRRAAPDAPPAAAAANEFIAHVRSAIDRLPERQRTAIILRHLENLGYPEIAELMDVSESTARVQVRNGRENLRRILVRMGHAPDATSAGPPRASPPAGFEPRVHSRGDGGAA